MEDFVRVGVSDTGEEPGVGQRALDRMPLGPHAFGKVSLERGEWFESAPIVRREGIGADADMHRRAPLGPGLRQVQRSTRKLEHRERLGYYAVGGCGANIAWHTEEDLIHIADRDILLTDIRIYLASVMGVANETVAPFNFRETLRSMRDTLEAYARPVLGLVDFTPARTAFDELDAALEKFGVHACKVAALAVGDAATRRTNRALRRLARLLVPVNYTRGPEFFHDPAETTPALPDLSPALQAPEMSDWDRGFLRTHLVRGQNRLVAALRDGRRTLERAMETTR